MAINNIVRKARKSDLQAIVKIEQDCFPREEAATELQIKNRIESYGDHFLVMEQEGSIVGIINGIVSDYDTIRDDMYENTAFHKETGQWQMIFGLDVIEKYRKKGFATLLMQSMIHHAQVENRKGVILTCKENLIPFYERFGFANFGVSESVHGGVVWYDMKLIFNK